MLATPTRGRYDGLLLRLLRDEGPRSRTRLSEETGLSPTTITKSITPLIERGWIEELAENRIELRIGRPAIGLRQVPKAIAVAGVQIGVGMVRAGLADGWARAHSTVFHGFDTALPPEQVIANVAGILEQLIASAEHPVLAVGVAAPGAVDRERRTNLLAVNLGWRDVPIADQLEARLGIPVIVDHNVRAMALAEVRYGGHGVDSMAYVYVRTGVGLGLVLHGEPFFGGSHGVSELGHIRVVDSGGSRCACGASGCLETVVSEPFLRSNLERAGVVLPPGSEPALFQILEAERARDGIDALRAEVVDHLARALASVVNLLSPDVIILGGAMAEAPESFIDDLRAAVERAAFPLLRDAVRLERPRLAEAGVSGGAAAALESVVYSDPADGR